MARAEGSSGRRWALIGGLIAGGVAIVSLIPIIKKRAMQPATILKKDHLLVSGMIMTLEMMPRINEAARKALFDQIHQHLLVHAQAEEEVLYPAMRKVMMEDTEGKISEAYREHQIVKDLLSDMATMDTLSDAFDAKLTQLKNNINHHVEEEEGELFPMMNDRITGKQLQTLGKRLHNRKKGLKDKVAA